MIFIIIIQYRLMQLLIHIVFCYNDKRYATSSTSTALVADLFLFCYEKDFMLSLSDDNQSDVIEAFNSISRYLDDLLSIGNNFFDIIVNRIYPTELQLN